MRLSGLRLAALCLWVLAIAALGMLAWARVGPSATEAAEVEAVTIGQGDYRLTATDGSAFTEDALKGAPSAVFFGFTHCPDVCPTTLGEIAAWQEELDAPIRAFFVTVDPERDTAEILADYTGWVPGLLGVTGSREETDRAVEAFRAYAAKVPLEDGGYTMDHSAHVLLFDSAGRFFEPIGYGEGIDRAVEKIRRLQAL